MILDTFLAERVKTSQAFGFFEWFLRDKKREVHEPLTLLLPTKHILQVKYWSLIFSASRITCSVILSDVGVVAMNELCSGKWR